MRVSITLRLQCRCGREQVFARENDAWISSLHNEAAKLGWRVDSKFERAWCPKCGRKELPFLYEKEYQYFVEKVDASRRRPPRLVRRVRAEDRKPPKKVPRRL